MAYPLTSPPSTPDDTGGSARRVRQSPLVASFAAQFALALLVGFLTGLALLYVAARPLVRLVRLAWRRVLQRILPGAVWMPWSAEEAAALLRRHG